MRIETVRRYASGKAPFLGVPVFTLETGRYITAIFRREHLQAAVNAPVIKAHYDEHEHVLVLNGTKRAEYRLRDLKNGESAAWLPWIMREELEKWAQAQRGRLNRKTNTPAERKIEKLAQNVKRLEREKEKLYVHDAPIGPMAPYERDVSDGWRENELRWHEEKELRRAVGKLAHSPRKTWKQFYADVEAVIGRHVDSGKRHDRVCNRKNGPDVIDYLHKMPRYIWMARKGYSRGKKWEPDFQRHREAQLDYLKAKRELESLQGQIDAHLEEIAELRGSR